MLFLNDDEIAVELREDPKAWEAKATVLEREGLPRRDPLFQNRRFWPAVIAFLERRAGFSSDKKETEMQSGFKARSTRSTASDKSQRGSATILAGEQPSFKPRLRTVVSTSVRRD